MNERRIIEGGDVYKELREAFGIDNILTDSYRCEFFYTEGALPFYEKYGNFWLKYSTFDVIFDLSLNSYS